jgi:hypothetical protein
MRSIPVQSDRSTQNTLDEIELIQPALFLQIFSNLPETSKSLMPFVLLQYLATNHLSAFIKSTLTTWMPLDEDIAKIPDANVKTNCVYTAHAVALLFMGEKKAERNMQRLRMQSSLPCDIELPSGKKWEYKINNLLSGDVIHGINHDPDFDSSEKEVKYEKQLGYLNKNLNKFFDSTRPAVDKILNNNNSKSEGEIIAELQHYFGNLDYQFNYMLLKKLYCEIIQKEKRVSDNNSIIYCVGIVDTKVGNTVMFDHVFIIEQSWCAKKQNIGYRLYQSWIGKGTILDELNHLSSNKGEIFSLDQQTLKRFLCDLTKLYCKDNSPQAYQKCFGYRTGGKALLSFQDNTLTGLNLRYFSAEVDPQACFENLINLTKSNPEFAETLKRNINKSGMV